MSRDDLLRLSKEDLVEMALRSRRPDKTSRNSSKPPSSHRKERRAYVENWLSARREEFKRLGITGDWDRPYSTMRFPAKALADLFGLVISEGALMNISERTKAGFEDKRDGAMKALRRARFVSRDETGARIEGVNALHWVLCCEGPSFMAPTSLGVRWSCAKP
jgi:hypothetical protein